MTLARVEKIKKPEKSNRLSDEEFEQFIKEMEEILVNY